MVPTEALDGLELPTAISLHKLFPPPVYPGAVQREQIIGRVMQDASPGVTVLQGPAGHGKSTTLQQIMAAHEARGWRTAWLTLDDGDNDPQRFESHVRALLAVLQGGRAPLRSQRPDSGDMPRSLADAILEQLIDLGAPVAFVLDEFQVLQSDGLLRLFRSLLARLPSHVRLFIGSRTLPDIGLATLLVNRKAVVLRAENLRFTHDEARRFFAASKELGVSAREVGAIYRRTEGWAAGLQLFRLALASPEVRTSLDADDYRGPRELAEYLTDNVVSLQSPRVQEFLLKTSVLRRLCAPLCATITGFDDAQDILMQLERSGLFVRALDSGNRWFKYHGLFANFLADNLRRISAAQVATVHHRAARWYLAHRMPEECLHHAVACHNFTLATATLTDWSAELVSSANLVTLEHWYDRLPFHQVAAELPLVIRASYALAFLRRRAKLQPLVELMAPYATSGNVASTTCPDLCRAMTLIIAQDDLGAALDIIDRPDLLELALDGFPAFELGAASNVLAYGKIASGDFEGARKALMLAAVHCKRGAGPFVSEYATANAGIRLIIQGCLQEAIEQLRMPAPQEAALDTSVASAARAAIHIWALYEANELETLEALCARFQREISESAAPHFIGVAYLAMARMHELQRRPEQAQQLLDELERIGHESRWQRLLTVIDWERVRRAWVAGEIDRAATLASQLPYRDGTEDSRWIHPTEDVEGEAYGRIRLAIAQGDHGEAARRIARERARQPARVLRQIKLGVLEALLHRHRGASDKARRSLRMALQLARQGRYVRCLLDEGGTVLQMLREEHQQRPQPNDAAQSSIDPDRAYLQHLLAAGGSGTADPRPPGAVPLEPLSEREKEMLQYLANGASNKELASRLFVSENTVKFHLKNIYAKLGVNSRLQAINAARAVRLVS